MPWHSRATTVRRASLHNADFIEAFDLHIDDQVLVEKGGEIIPKIVGVVTEERPSDAQPVIFPQPLPRLWLSPRAKRRRSRLLLHEPSDLSPTADGSY